MGRQSFFRLFLRKALPLTVFTGLLFLIILTPIPYGATQVWWTSIFEIAVFALAIVALVHYSIAPDSLSSKQMWLVMPLIAISLYALLQTIPFPHEATPLGAMSQPISFDPQQTRSFALRIGALALVLTMLLQYTKRRSRLLILTYCVIGIVLASSIFGIVRQLSQRNQTGFWLPALEKNSGYAQFINRNHFAFLAEMGLGLLMGLIAGVRPRTRSLVYLALALPIWTALVFSSSRGGILAMLSEIVFLIGVVIVSRKSFAPFATANSRWRLASIAVGSTLALVLVIGILLGTIWIGGEPLASRLSDAREDITSQSVDRTRADRASIWAATLRLWHAHPLTGVGFGAYWMAITGYHRGSGELVPQEAHNDYLELAASGGVIGIALFVWFLIIVARRTIDQLRASDHLRCALSLGAATGLFGVAVHSLVDFGLHLTGNALLGIVLIVIATQRIDA